MTIFELVFNELYLYFYSINCHELFNNCYVLIVITNYWIKAYNRCIQKLYNIKNNLTTNSLLFSYKYGLKIK